MIMKKDDISNDINQDYVIFLLVSHNDVLNVLNTLYNNGITSQTNEIVLIGENDYDYDNRILTSAFDNTEIVRIFDIVDDEDMYYNISYVDDKSYKTKFIKLREMFSVFHYTYQKTKNDDIKNILYVAYMNKYEIFGRKIPLTNYNVIPSPFFIVNYKSGSFTKNNTLEIDELVLNTDIMGRIEQPCFFTNPYSANKPITSFTFIHYLSGRYNNGERFLLDTELLSLKIVENGGTPLNYKIFPLIFDINQNIDDIITVVYFFYLD